VLPVVIQGDRHVVVGHVAQLREFLGMPPEEGAEWNDLVDAAERVLLAFERLLTQLREEDITKPTPNRGRDMRNMTVNIFSLMEELIVTMRTKHFSYQAHKDHDKISVDMKSVADLRAYAKHAREKWIAAARAFPRERIDEPITTDRKGDLTQYQALDAGSRHAAGHLRQAYAFLRQLGIEPIDEMTREEMAPIQVQESLY